jgi:hypothetical protein
MKTALVRMLTLISLATSLTCHAAAGEAKQKDAVSPSAKQTGCADAGQGKKQKEKKGHDNSTGEQDFERLLMGIYG